MSPTDKILAALESHGCRVHQSSKGWTAQCPAHEDRNPSLSISEGDNDRAMLRCHAGCDVESICRALRLELKDLMPEDPNYRSPRASTSTQPPKSSETKQLCRSRRNKPSKVYQTADEAIAALEQQHGSRSAVWYYHDADSEPIGAVVRWDRPAGGKDIRPIARCGNGWQVGGMADPRPLYGLPDLGGAERVYIVEGEKAAATVRSLDLVATTSAQGSKSAAKTDWSPLAGKECVILPDNDEPGERYVKSVIGLLGKLSPPPNVRVVRLEQLADRHGDSQRRRCGGLDRIAWRCSRTPGHGWPARGTGQRNGARVMDANEAIAGTVSIISDRSVARPLW